MKRFLCLFVALGWPLVVMAQGPAAVQAQHAAQALKEASVKLAEADNALDRVRALTETIQAYESGLSAMREGLRGAAIEENRLVQSLGDREAEVSQLLGALMMIGDKSTPVSLLHPDGPAGTARATMMASELAPTLNKRADGLRSELLDLRKLRRLKSDSASQLKQGLAQAQQARTELNLAIANRTNLPTRFTEDPVRTAILLASTDTLDAFAKGLGEIAVNVTDAVPLSVNSDIGNLPLPVKGQVVYAFNETDDTGVSRPGIVVGTLPQAIVTSPTAATVRYAGPLLDMGNIIILEPQADTLFVFAGLDVVYGKTGQVVESGMPIGLMGGQIAIDGSLNREGGGSDRDEALYIEVRQNNITQDPQDWFHTDKDE